MTHMLFSRFLRAFFVGAVTVSFCASLFAGQSMARPGMGMSLADRFHSMDTDKDGKVSPAEFTAALPNMRDTAFGAMDADQDGYLTLKEWEDAMATHGMAGGREGMQHNATGGPAKGPDLIMPSGKKTE